MSNDVEILDIDKNIAPIMGKILEALISTKVGQQIYSDTYGINFHSVSSTDREKLLFDIICKYVDENDISFLMILDYFMILSVIATHHEKEEFMFYAERLYNNNIQYKNIVT